MKLQYFLFLVLLSSTVSCSEIDIPDSETGEDINLIELELVLKGELLSPTNKLKSKTVLYQYVTYEEYYYNSSGDAVLTIHFDENVEIKGYSINSYDSDHKITESKTFTIEEKGPKYFISTNYSYNSSNQLTNISKGSGGIFRVINEYFYDQKDRLTEINGPIPGGGDKVLFFYESQESNKVKEEHFFWDRPTTIPYYRYKVNYDNQERLVSKTVSRGESEVSGFEYFYNSNGFLIEEKEYDLHFGPQEIKTTIYEYD